MSLGLLGSGGSILTVPILIYMAGQSDKMAIASSLAIVGGIALFGALVNQHLTATAANPAKYPQALPV